MAGTRALGRIARGRRRCSAGGLLALLIVAGWLPFGAARAAAADGWSWPLAPRPSVVRGFEPPAGPYAAGHRGVDLSALPGASVRAAGAGVVAFAGRVAGRGVVSVDHAGGLRTTYEPVASSVSRGDRITAGMVIGRLELPGSHCFPAACLHWGLRRGSTYLDPLTLVGAAQVRLLPIWSAEGLAPAALGKPRSASTAATRGARAARGVMPSRPGTGSPRDGPPLVPAGLALVGGVAAVGGLARGRAAPR